MERRFYLGAMILAVLLLAGLLTGLWAQTTRTPAELLTQAAQTEDMAQAASLADQAKALWQTRWKPVAAVADHTPMDEIDSLFAEMQIYADAGERVHFAACCKQLVSLLHAVSDAHALNWWNILAFHLPAF